MSASFFSWFYGTLEQPFTSTTEGELADPTKRTVTTFYGTSVIGKSGYISAAYIYTTPPSPIFQ